MNEPQPHRDMAELLERWAQTCPCPDCHAMRTTATLIRANRHLAQQGRDDLPTR